jgi:uncharacterized protein
MEVAQFDCGAALGPIRMNGPDHDPAGPGFAQHFDNAITIARDCAARRFSRDAFAFADAGIDKLANVSPSLCRAAASTTSPRTHKTVKGRYMRRISVRSSPVHGRGVFALVRIAAGETIVEYKGKVISWKEAQRCYERSGSEAGHTFFFDLDDGRVIDGAQGGNSARWINHSCAPNAETEQDGTRVYVRALQNIEVGTELFIDYQLTIDARMTAAVRRVYACRCGARACRGTMLASSR